MNRKKCFARTVSYSASKEKGNAGRNTRRGFNSCWLMTHSMRTEKEKEKKRVCVSLGWLSALCGGSIGIVVPKSSCSEPDTEVVDLGRRLGNKRSQIENVFVKAYAERSCNML